MKVKRNVKLLSLATAALLAIPRISNAAALAQESFNYPTGDLNNAAGGAGWGANWVVNVTSPLYVVVTNFAQGPMIYPVSGAATINGGATGFQYQVPTTSVEIKASRQLAAPLNSTFYAAYLLRYVPADGSANWGGAANTFCLHFATSASLSTSTLNFGIRGTTANDFLVRSGTGSPTAGQNTGGHITNNATYYLVVRVDRVGSTFTSAEMWLNPASNAESTKPNGDAQITGTSFGDITHIFFRATANEPNDIINVDELKIGSSFADMIAGGPSFSITTTNTPTAGVPFTVTVQATDGVGNPTNGLPVTTLNLSKTGSLQLSTNQVTILNGSNVSLSVTDNVAETVSITATPTSGNFAPGSGSFTIAAGPMAGLKVLAEGEGYALAAKTGTPNTQGPGIPFPVTIIGLDALGNATTNGVDVNDTVHLASSDPNAVLPSDAAMVNGTLIQSVILSNTPSQTITATDVTAGGITADTSSIIPVGTSLVIAQDFFNYPSGTGTTLAGDNGGIGWTNGWFVGTNSSLVSVQVVDTTLLPPELNYFPADGGPPVLGGTTKVDNVTTGINASQRSIYGSRRLAAPLAQTCYIGYLMRIDTNDLTIPGNFNAYFSQGSAGTENTPDGINFGMNGSDSWIIREGSAGGTTVSLPGSTAPGALNYVVARLTYVNGTFTTCDLWINPTNGSLATPAATFTAAGSYPGLNWLYFRGSSQYPNGYSISHFKIGRFWNDIVPAALPTAIDHFAVTSPASQTVSSNYTITVTAMDASNVPITSDNSTVVTMISSGGGQFDANNDGAFGDNTNTLVNGVATFTAKDNVAQVLTNTAVAVVSGKVGSSTITIAATTFVGMQVLVPGETAVPGSVTGKMGTPIGQTGGTPFALTMNAVDAFWNVVPTVSDSVSISSSDPSSAKVLPTGVALSSGTASGNVMLITPPSQTISLRDVTNPSITTNTSPPILLVSILTWFGDGGANLWDTNSPNWRIGGFSAAYSDFFAPLFDDSSTNQTVNLAVNVSPKGVTVNGTQNYTINGVGKITGTNRLVMNSSGILTISTTNTFSGGVVVSNGTVRAGSSNAMGTGAIKVNTGAVLDLNGQILTNAVTQIKGDGVDGFGALVNNSTPAALTTGWNNGNTNFSITGSGDITLPAITGTANWTLTQNSSGTVTYGGASDNGFMILLVNSGTAVLAKPSNAASGSRVVGGSGPADALTLNDGVVRIAPGGNGDQIYDFRRITINAGVFDLNGSSETIDGINGSGGSITNSSATLATLTLGGTIAGGTLADGPLFLGTIDGPLAITKAGTNSQILAGTYTYTGNTLISGGTLSVWEPASIGKSTQINISATNAVLDVTGRNDQTLTLNNGQTLTGVGTVNGNVTDSAGSIINPGGIKAIGTLTVVNNIGLGGMLQMELNRTNVQTCDRLVSTSGAITYGGTLAVTNIGPALHVGDTFQLFPAAVTGFTGYNLATNDASHTIYQWTNMVTLNGSVQVLVVIPYSPTPPVIRSTTVSGTNLVMVSSGGTNDQCVLLTSTNLTLPRSSWTPVATNTVGANGLSTNSIPIIPGTPQKFYLLSIPVQ
jgi:autotransporter-associated beta strand protein